MNVYLARLRAVENIRNTPGTLKTLETPIGVGFEGFEGGQGSPFSEISSPGAPDPPAPLEAILPRFPGSYLARLLAEKSETPLPEAPSKPSKPLAGDVPQLPAALEAILDRFPGAEIISARRYDLPDPSQLEPLAMANHPTAVCAQCRDSDGLALRWLDRRQSTVVWLHKECRRHYLARRLI